MVQDSQEEELSNVETLSDIASLKCDKQSIAAMTLKTEFFPHISRSPSLVLFWYIIPPQ
jgi:hypothetical protein